MEQDDTDHVELTVLSHHEHLSLNKVNSFFLHHHTNEITDDYLHDILKAFDLVILPPPDGNFDVLNHRTDDSSIIVAKLESVSEENITELQGAGFDGLLLGCMNDVRVARTFAPEILIFLEVENDIPTKENLEILSGVLVKDLTVKDAGRCYSIPQLDTISLFVKQVKERSDFIIMVHECVSRPVFEPALAPRFAKFCRDNGVIGQMCVAEEDDVCTLLEPILDYNITPLTLLDSDEFVEFTHNIMTLPLAKPEPLQPGVPIWGDDDDEDDPLTALIGSPESVLASSLRDSGDPLTDAIDAIGSARGSNLSLGVKQGEEMHRFTMRTICAANTSSDPDCAYILEQLQANTLYDPLTDANVTQFGAPIVDSDDYYNAEESEADNEERLTTVLEIPDSVDISGPGSSIRLTGQKEFGFEHDESDFTTVVKVMRDLRLGGLLRNLSQKRMTEVATDNPAKNKVTMQDSAVLEDILAKLARAGRRKHHTKDVNNPVYHMKELTSLLTQGNRADMDHMLVQLWECDKFGLTSSSGNRYYAVSELSSGTLHIYIRAGHPNPAEAVVHQFLQSRGFNNTQCVLTEALVADLGKTELTITPHQPHTLTEEIEDATADVFMQTDELHTYTKLEYEQISHASSRIIHQIDHASLEELMGFIQRYRKIVKVMNRRRDLTNDQRRGAVKLGHEVMLLSTQMLLNHTKHFAITESVIERLSKRPSAVGSIEVTRLFKEAAWNPSALKKVMNILQAVNSAMKDLGTSSIMYQAILEGIRHVQDAALVHFEMLVRDTVPFLVREADVCTVMIEMAGHSEDDMKRRFDIGKHDTGRVIYHRVRQSMALDDEGDVRFGKLGPNPEENDTEDVTIALSPREYVKKFFDGLFFMFPFTVNLVLALLTGVGLYTSTKMRERDQYDAGVGMILGFLVSGTLNWAVAKLGSWYFYQWSYSVLIVIFSRLLWMGAMGLAVIGIIVGRIVVAFNPDASSSILFAYCVLIGLSQLLVGALFNTRMGSIWTSYGGAAILGSLALSLTFVMVMIFVVNFPNALVIHLIGQGLLLFLLLAAFLAISHHLLGAFDGLKGSTDACIMDFYGQKIPKTDDELFDWWNTMHSDVNESRTEVLIKAKKKVVQLQRMGRTAFKIAVEQELKGIRLFSKAHHEVKRRAKQWQREQLILEWYCLLTGKDQPEAFSAEYEAFLNEATVAMAIKRRTDVVHRGGLLWEATRSYMLHGLLYFLLLFSDRIIRFLIGDDELPFFLPTGEYEVSIGWAQFFLLLSVGTLETLPSRTQTLLSMQDMSILKNESDFSKLIAAHKRASWTIWKSELLLDIRFVLAGLVFTLGCMFITLDEQTAKEEFILFSIACVGYLFFVLGGFNLLYTGNVGGHVTRSIAIAVVSGYASGLAAILGCRYGGADWAAIGLGRLRNEDLAVVSVLVAGVVYGVLSLPMFGKESGLEVEWELSTKSPLMTTAMQTSGQHWIQCSGKPVAKGGDDDTALLRYHFALNTLLDTLSKQKDIIEVSADTMTGILVCEILENSIAHWNDMNDYSLQKRAFPKADEQLRDILTKYHDGDVTLMMVDQRHMSLVAGGGQRTVFSGLSRLNDVKRLDVFAAIDRDRSAMAQASHLAETLVHECMEQYYGMHHSFAVASELLLGDYDNPLPIRIVAEMEHSSDERLLDMIHGTNDSVLASSMMFAVPIDELDILWDRLSHQSRALMIGLVKRVLCQDLPVTQLRLRAYLGMEEHVYNKGVEELCASVPPIPDDDSWDRRLALSELCARLAALVKNEARNQLNKRVIYQSTSQRVDEYDDQGTPGFEPNSSELSTVKIDQKMPMSIRVQMYFDSIFRLLFLAISGDVSFPVELHHAAKMPMKSGGLDWLAILIARTVFVAVFFLSRVCAYALLWTAVRLFRPSFRMLWQQMQNGLNRTLYYSAENRHQLTRIVRQDPLYPSTAFVKDHMVSVYKGVMQEEPTDCRDRVSLCEYTESFPRRLVRSMVTDGVTILRTCFYSYPDDRTLVPIQRRDYADEHDVEPTDRSHIEAVAYSAAGRVIGSIFRVGSLVVEGSYAHRRGPPAEASAVYHSYFIKGDNAPFQQLEVCFFPDTDTVRTVRFKKTDKSEWLETQYSYSHPRHPIIKTFVLENGKVIRGHETPNAVLEDVLGLQFKKSPATSFFEEDLIHDKIPKSSTSRSGNIENVFTSSYSTRKARKVLWRAWEAGETEGVLAQLLDEGILRSEPVLARYFMYRDIGMVETAQNRVLMNEGTITPVIDFGMSNSHLILRVSDLYVCGIGGSSHHNGSLIVKDDSSELDLSDWSLRFDGNKPLDILGLDSGTWPADGGGVASCRRDLVNRLPRLRWSMMAEIGSPMKLVQKSYQIEKNVKNLTFTPMWGTELGGPVQTVLSSEPIAHLSLRSWITTPELISTYFVPILTQLTNIAGFESLASTKEREHATALFVNLYHYFQRFDWDSTWHSQLVRQAWRTTWITIESRKWRHGDQRLNRELPCLEDIDFALSTLIHFFMPFTAPLPKHNYVVQATHHGMQALMGAVAKRINGSGFIVWDHGVLWRERAVALSQVDFPLFVRNVLLAFTRLAVGVVFHNADVVVPVSTCSNPEWEQRLGGHGRNRYLTAMERRISPVLNGMETDRFHVDRSSEQVMPTAVMLSHVYDLKDIKTAIRAAAIVVDTYRVSSFRLLIYGSTDKDLEYTDECRAIIADLGMGDHVQLMGLGNSSKVLPSGWVFVNSSKSEGLPLALGEAGLAGVPVVCTDVGGSREVVSDEKADTVYGAIVPAQSPDKLARGIVNVLAMDDTLEYGDDLEEKMFANKNARQILGMKYRAFVLNSFNMDRYLREHEQLIWICAQRYHDRMIGPTGSRIQATTSSPGGAVPSQQASGATYMKFLRDLQSPSTVVDLWSEHGASRPVAEVDEADESEESDVMVVHWKANVDDRDDEIVI